MSRVYFYVVDRDFGFAPNPFHGFCTLATCKANVRAKAQIADWIVGMGGSRLKATGRCIFAMQVDQILSFTEYWLSPDCLDKRPVRNGSSKMMVGDNIYHRDPSTNAWHQADSHHSNPDGTVNGYNLAKDTKADRVLISDHFFFFGSQAPQVPQAILDDLEYRNCRDRRVFQASACTTFFRWLQENYGRQLNLVSGDPFDFAQSFKRYDSRHNRIR